MSKRDYYEVLGVERETDQQQLKSAYRKLALKYHPDKNRGDSQAEERFKEAAEAYSVLADPEKRAQYDRFGHAGVSSSAGGFGGFGGDPFSDLGDIFGDFFGFGDIFGNSRRGRGGQAQRGTDLRYDFKIPFEQAVFGSKTKIKIPREESCSECRGSGAEPGSTPSTCPGCKGDGQVRYQQGFFTISRTCSQCQGTGQIVENACRHCRGTGREKKEKVLEIRIPAGVDDGSRLRISGEGESGIQGGPPGDLYVVLSVEEHPFFRREQNHLFCEISLSISRAVLGTQMTVPSLEGNERLKIPEGTQSGTVFRLRGKGVASPHGGGRGDQFVKVNVSIPKRLTKEQKELFQQLADVSDEEHQEHEGFFGKVKEVFS